MSQNKIWYLPLERLEERYTGMLFEHTIKELEDRDVDYEVIEGEPLTESVESGAVLDSESRHHYCFSQLNKFLRKIKDGEVSDGDVVFNQDFWHTGIEAIPYIEALRDWDLSMYGIICSGSFEKWDFTNLNGMRDWAKHIERGWFEAYDGLFVNNRRMREMVKPEIRDPSKIHVAGLPLDQEWIYDRAEPKESEDKEDIVVFPHRWDEEKEPEMFNRLADRFEGEDVRFVHTTGREGDIGNGPEMSDNVELIQGKSKEEYYRFLSRSKIIFSSALQDTVGYSMTEAISLGNTPVVPEGQYNDYISEEFRYQRGSVDDAEKLVRHYLVTSNHRQIPESVERFNNSTRDMLNVMCRENDVGGG